MTKISGQLSTINRNQKYFRTRENRNFSTVRSTERRIFNFSVVESAMMVCMAGLQVFIVRFFFQGARKGECGEICEDGFGGTGSLMGNRVCVREETGGGGGGFALVGSVYVFVAGWKGHCCQYCVPVRLRH